MTQHVAITASLMSQHVAITASLLTQHVAITASLMTQHVAITASLMTQHVAITASLMTRSRDDTLRARGIRKAVITTSCDIGCAVITRSVSSTKWLDVFR